MSYVAIEKLFGLGLRNLPFLKLNAGEDEVFESILSSSGGIFCADGECLGLLKGRGAPI